MKKGHLKLCAVKEICEENEMQVAKDVWLKMYPVVLYRAVG